MGRRISGFSSHCGQIVAKITFLIKIPSSMPSRAAIVSAASVLRHTRLILKDRQVNATAFSPSDKNIMKPAALETVSGSPANDASV